MDLLKGISGMQGLEDNQLYYKSPKDSPSASVIDKLKSLRSKFIKDSVMEPGFIDSLTEPEGSPINYDNIESLAGSRIRDAFIDPMKRFGSAIDKGVTGQQLTIGDQLALIEGMIDMTSGGVFKKSLSKGAGFDPNNLYSFPAFHGTPHKISGNKFSLQKIGSGEGAAAFGRGIYLTDDRNVAEYYAKTLGGKKNVYKTTVMPGKQPSEYRFLQWEEEVPADVIESAKKILDRKNIDYGNIFHPGWGKIKGDDLLTRLEVVTKNSKIATEVLEYLGFSGIKYDTGSLSVGPISKGKSNYVVFNPEDIRIDSVDSVF